MGQPDWTVSDISQVTTDLVNDLQTAIDSSPLWAILGASNKFTVTVTGAMPEAVRKKGDCQLSLYLLHVSPNKFHRNTYPTGGGPQPNKSQPQALDLYYLLTAYADDKANQEQQAMSMAMQWLYTRTLSTLAKESSTQRYSITMEAQTADELSRLWQALSTPLRLSAVYKVSVLFLAPDADLPAVQPRPQQVGLAVGPATLPSSSSFELFATAITVRYSVPSSSTSPEDVTMSVAPSVVRAGDQLLAMGDGLDLATRVFLTDLNGADVEVTQWRDTTTPSQTMQSRLTLSFPTVVGNAPTGSVDPGVYTISVESSIGTRSNKIPVSVAARIDNATTPPTALTPNGSGLYTVQGAGFTAGATQVSLGATPLTSAPTEGGLQILSDTQLTFNAPPGLPPGRYFLGIRVNHVDSPPSWFVDL